jgi:hypothetical protein
MLPKPDSRVSLSGRPNLALWIVINTDFFRLSATWECRIMSTVDVPLRTPYTGWQ